MDSTSRLGLNLPAASDFADVEKLNENFRKLDNAATVGEDGKIPKEQLPELHYDPEGSSEAVQTALNSHIQNKNNPHGVTAEQVGADKAGTAEAKAKTVQNNLDTHASDKSNPHTVTAAQVGADVVGSAAAVKTELTAKISELTKQLGGNMSVATGSYEGTGDDVNSLQFPFTPKVLIVMLSEENSYAANYPSPLVIVGMGNYTIMYRKSSSSKAELFPISVSNFSTTVTIRGEYNYLAYNDSGEHYIWVAMY